MRNIQVNEEAEEPRELKQMSRNSKTEFPRYIRWFVFDLRHKGLLDDDDNSKISIGLYCNSQAMEETYASLVSCENMTSHLLIHHLVATARELDLMRDRQLANYRGNPFFLHLLMFCLPSLHNTERREDYGVSKTAPYSTFHALFSRFYCQRDNEKKVKHFKKE